MEKPVVRVRGRVKPDLLKLACKDLKLKDTLGTLALDVRTDLVPASQMFTKNVSSARYHHYLSSLLLQWRGGLNGQVMARWRIQTLLMPLS